MPEIQVFLVVVVVVIVVDADIGGFVKVTGLLLLLQPTISTNPTNSSRTKPPRE